MLIENGINESELFICCATTSYCKSINSLFEYNHAKEKGKRIIYILFENFNDKKETIDKLDRIDLARNNYYKITDFESVIKVLETQVNVRLFI